MLSNGRVEDHGEVPQVIATYLSKSRIDGDSLWLRPDTLPIELAGFKRVAITVDGSASHMILRCNLQLVMQDGCPPTFLAADILEPSGAAIMQALPNPEPFLPSAIGQHEVYLQIELPPLIPDWVLSGSDLVNASTYDLIERVVAFDIMTSPTPGRTFPHSPDHGLIVPRSFCRIPPANKGCHKSEVTNTSFGSDPAHPFQISR